MMNFITFIIINGKIRRPSPSNLNSQQCGARILTGITYLQGENKKTLLNSYVMAVIYNLSSHGEIH